MRGILRITKVVAYESFVCNWDGLNNLATHEINLNLERQSWDPDSVWRIGSHLTNFRHKSPAWIVDSFDTSEGQPYPILFFAITLTWYSLFGLRWVNRHDWVDWETFFVVHCSSELAAFISARYPVTIPPSASCDGGLQVKFIELQPRFKSECLTGYGTSIKSESSFSINKQK